MKNETNHDVGQTLQDINQPGCLGHPDLPEQRHVLNRYQTIHPKYRSLFHSHQRYSHRPKSDWHHKGTSNQPFGTHRVDNTACTAGSRNGSPSLFIDKNG